MPDVNESFIAGWFDDFKKYAEYFYSIICSADEEFRNIVTYDESDFDKVFERYKVYRNMFHNIIKGDLIDRHKILASIILAATDEEDLIFKVDYEAIERSSKSNFPYWVIYPNEYYICTLLLRILTDFVLTTTKRKKLGLSEENYDIRFQDKIVWWEKDLFGSYKEQFCQMLSLMITADDITLKCSLLASHLVYFYELAYDCAIMGLSKTYYD
jgi:hypothetical protein